MAKDYQVTSCWEGCHRFAGSLLDESLFEVFASSECVEVMISKTINWEHTKMAFLQTDYQLPYPQPILLFRLLPTLYALYD